MDDYLIWSNEHRRWWGPGHRGYVTKVSEAGRYSREAALMICQQAIGTARYIGLPAELPVRLQDIKDFTSGQFVPEFLAGAANG